MAMSMYMRAYDAYRDPYHGKLWQHSVTRNKMMISKKCWIINAFRHWAARRGTG